MSGFGFPGEKLFRWVYHAIKGYECANCKRKMPRDKLYPYGVSSFACTDRKSCGIIARACEYCSHRVERGDVEMCNATGVEKDWYQMVKEKGPCGWERKLFVAMPDEFA